MKRGCGRGVPSLARARMADSSRISLVLPLGSDHVSMILLVKMSSLRLSSVLMSWLIIFSSAWSFSSMITGASCAHTRDSITVATVSCAGLARGRPATG